VGGRLKGLVLSCSNCAPENVEFSGVNVSLDDWVIKDGYSLVEGIGNEFELVPREFVRMRLVETINMPKYCMAMFTLRSKYAQMGLEQCTSVWLKPLWKGNLILELKNFSNVNTILLSPGDLVGQLTFFDCED
jgi:deoxycytidine triphosphate deaminase